MIPLELLLLQAEIIGGGIQLFTFIGGAIAVAAASIGGITWLASRKADAVRKDLTDAIGSNKTEIGTKLDTLATSINNQASAQVKQGDAIVGIATELKNHLIAYSGEMASIKTTVNDIKTTTSATGELADAIEVRRKAHGLNKRQPHSVNKKRRRK